MYKLLLTCNMHLSHDSQYYYFELSLHSGPVDAASSNVYYYHVELLLPVEIRDLMIHFR